jgi:protein-S-isoprenylcysteine O-methyltransferase Ste14
MKFVFAFLLLLCGTTFAQERPLLLQPLWLQLKAAEIEKLPAQRPPRSISRATFQGKTVYYVTPACCDIPSELYDDSGTLMCFPDGGFAGGDGRCPGFSLAAGRVSTVWRDERGLDGGPRSPSRNTDLLLYALHLLFWAAFVVTRLLVGRRAAAAAPAPGEADAHVVAEVRTAPHSRALLALHTVAFALVYFGIGNAVLAGRVPELFAGQRIVGALVIAVGGAIACWAVASCASWRFRAQLAPGHQLATGGPFRLVRHPIYLGLDLLALGSALWAPTPVLWFAFVLMVVGGDLRARAEEKLLAASFGDAYDDYCRRTRRFLPGIY